MKKALTQTRIVITLILLLSYGSTLAQTKTEIETIELKTNNPAITVKVIRAC